MGELTHISEALADATGEAMTEWTIREEKSIIGELQDACSILQSCELSMEIMERSIIGLHVACDHSEIVENNVAAIVNDLAKRLDRLDDRLRILHSMIRHEDE